MNKISFRIGLTLALTVTILLIFIAVTEYLDCAPTWSSMCGTGLPIIALLLGLGIPIITTSIFDYILKIFDVSLTHDYVPGAILIILTVGITYFIIGYFLGWIYRKITNK
ncbi:MAG: hypothetical protein RLY49_625 [Candidatus Parcubacteria bacterium]|jgi:hypothetical protein